MAVEVHLAKRAASAVPSRNMQLRRFRLTSRSEMKHANIGQIAIAFVIIQTVADHEFIRYNKTSVIRANVGDTALDLIEEHDDAEKLGLLLFKEPEQVLQGQAGIENVLHDD